LFKIKLLITNHLGKNPKNGGKPPNEKKCSIKENLIDLEKFIELNN
jgi:hypothetical protein